LRRLHFGHQGYGTFSANERRRKGLDLPRQKDFSLTKVLLLVAFGDRILATLLSTLLISVVDTVAEYRSVRLSKVFLT
jgi:hypothetical protein